MQEFISQVRRQIDKQGLSIISVAKAARVTPAYVYRILDGRQVPSLAIAYRLAAAVGLKFKISKSRC